LLLPLFHGISSVYITEHIPKYCSIENFIKLPFLRVLIHLNWSPNEGAIAVLFPLFHAVKKISERATFGNSAISACRNLRLTRFMIHWKRNFMGLLNIQRYPVILPWGCAEIDANIDFLWIDPNMLTTLILWSSGHYVASPSALSHRHCWTSEYHDGNGVSSSWFYFSQSDGYFFRNVIASNTYCLNKQTSMKH
jgi:hypothetical protein